MREHVEVAAGLAVAGGPEQGLVTGEGDEVLPFRAEGQGPGRDRAGEGGERQPARLHQPDFHLERPGRCTGRENGDAATVGAEGGTTGEWASVVGECLAHWLAGRHVPRLSAGL